MKYNLIRLISLLIKILIFFIRINKLNSINFDSTSYEQPNTLFQLESDVFIYIKKSSIWEFYFQVNDTKIDFNYDLSKYFNKILEIRFLEKDKFSIVGKNDSILSLTEFIYENNNNNKYIKIKHNFSLRSNIEYLTIKNIFTSYDSDKITVSYSFSDFCCISIINSNAVSEIIFQGEDIKLSGINSFKCYSGEDDNFICTISGTIRKTISTPFSFLAIGKKNTDNNVETKLIKEINSESDSSTYISFNSDLLRVINSKNYKYLFCYEQKLVGGETYTIFCGYFLYKIYPNLQISSLKQITYTVDDNEKTFELKDECPLVIKQHENSILIGWSGKLPVIIICDINLNVKYKIILRNNNFNEFESIYSLNSYKNGFFIEYTYDNKKFYFREESFTYECLDIEPAFFVSEGKNGKFILPYNSFTDENIYYGFSLSNNLKYKINEANSFYLFKANDYSTDNTLNLNYFINDFEDFSSPKNTRNYYFLIKKLTGTSLESHVDNSYYPESYFCPFDIIVCYKTCLTCYFERDIIPSYEHQYCTSCDEKKYFKFNDTKTGIFNCYSKNDTVEGYYFKTENFTKCHISCETCEDEVSCVKCKQDYARYENRTEYKLCYRDYELGYYYNKDKGIFSKCGKNCLYCLNESFCFKCNESYTLSSGKCETEQTGGGGGRDTVNPGEALEDRKIDERINIIKIYNNESKLYNLINDINNLKIEYVKTRKEIIGKINLYQQDKNIFLITSTNYLNYNITFYPLDIEYFTYEHVFNPRNLSFANFTNFYPNFYLQESSNISYIIIAIESINFTSHVNHFNYDYFSIDERKNEITYNKLSLQLSLLEIHYIIKNFTNTRLLNEEINNFKSSSSLTSNIQKLYLKDSNIDFYDYNNPFFSDICYKFTTEVNTDITIKDRYIEYYLNKVLCETNCTLIKVYNRENSTIPKSICMCGIKGREIYNNIDEDIKPKEIKNIKVLRCAKNVFKKEDLFNNTLFNIFSIIIIFEIEIALISLFSGNNIVKNLLLKYNKEDKNINEKKDELEEIKEISLENDLDNKNNLNEKEQHLPTLNLKTAPIHFPNKQNPPKKGNNKLTEKEDKSYMQDESKKQTQEELINESKRLITNMISKSKMTITRNDLVESRFIDMDIDHINTNIVLYNNYLPPNIEGILINNYLNFPMINEKSAKFKKMRENLNTNNLEYNKYYHTDWDIEYPNKYDFFQKSEKMKKKLMDNISNYNKYFYLNYDGFYDTDIDAYDGSLKKIKKSDLYSFRNNTTYNNISDNNNTNNNYDFNNITNNYNSSNIINNNFTRNNNQKTLTNIIAKTEQYLNTKENVKKKLNINNTLNERELQSSNRKILKKPFLKPSKKKRKEEKKKLGDLGSIYSTSTPFKENNSKNNYKGIKHFNNLELLNNQFKNYETKVTLETEIQVENLEKNFCSFYCNYFIKREICFISFYDKTQSIPYFIRYSAFLVTVSFIFTISCIFYKNIHIHNRFIYKLQKKEFNEIFYTLRFEIDKILICALITDLGKILFIKIIIINLFKFDSQTKEIFKNISEINLRKKELSYFKKKKFNYLQSYGYKICIYSLLMIVVTCGFGYICICYAGTFINSINAIILGFIFTFIFSFIICAVLCLIIVLIFKLASCMNSKSFLNIYNFLRTIY